MQTQQMHAQLAWASLSLTILTYKLSLAELEQEYDIMSRHYFPCEMGGGVEAKIKA